MEELYQKIVAHSEEGIFGICAFVAVATALGVVVTRKPMRAALCLIANFLSIAVLFVMLGAEVVAFMHILVYTGAIIMLFVFVVMLLNLNPDELGAPMAPLGKFAAGVVSVLLVYALVKIIMYPEYPKPAAESAGLAVLAKDLFGGYAIPFEATSALIIAGIVGALMLTRKR